MKIFEYKNRALILDYISEIEFCKYNKLGDIQFKTIFDNKNRTFIEDEKYEDVQQVFERLKDYIRNMELPIVIRYGLEE